jgi:hypothetical protein
MTRRPNRVKDPVARFHSRYTVNPTTGCWEWNARWGKPSNEFYPIFYADRRRQFATHWSLEHLAGTPTNGLLACHHCDNPRCVNPAHLFVGTHKDNTRDAMRKGRFVGQGRSAGFNHSEETKQKIGTGQRRRLGLL